jgi:hypothetical protein
MKNGHYQRKLQDNISQFCAMSLLVVAIAGGSLWWGIGGGTAVAQTQIAQGTMTQPQRTQPQMTTQPQRSIPPTRAVRVSPPGGLATPTRGSAVTCCTNWNTSTGGTGCATYPDTCPDNQFQVDCGPTGCW